MVLTLDIGTSSLRAMLFDTQARTVHGAEAQCKYDMRTTPDGGVEDDPDVMLARAAQALDQILSAAGGRASDIIAVASDQLVSNILGVDEHGQAITPVYTYADTRPAREVDQLRAHFDEAAVHQRVGTRFHTSYWPARFLWLARIDPALFKRVRWWMSLGEYFYFRWLGERACSYSTAAWSGLLNRQTLGWDPALLAALPITIEQLSPLVDIDATLPHLKSEYASRWPELANASWIPTIGDGAAANVGSGCVDTTRIALTIGTTSAMRVTVPPPQTGASGTLTIPKGLWSYRVDRDHELVGGAMTEGGNLYQWMRETLNLDADAAAVERELAALPPDGHGLTVLPFLAGERAPGWVADARAAIVGLSLNTRPIEILQAGLEAVAERLALIFNLLRDVAPDAHQVIASGGALMHSAVWAQMIADVIGVPVIPSAEPEATSRGTALLALKALKQIPALETLPAHLGQAYQPRPDRHAIYAAAVKRQQKWYNSVINPGPVERPG